eukprot:TRINITY_DN20239_c0_g1_i2.p1 TRINITY_DN20239_c0_g1~~TRINITY_DN20239_c0_g1_i2.p1  ORF type:complete len:139 (-),score=18.12 TRINITY_DN20239_c0_g1_i2:284-700(-)
MCTHYVFLSFCMLTGVGGLDKDQAIQFFHEVNKVMRAYPEEVPQWRQSTLAGKAPAQSLLDSTQIGRVYRGLANAFDIPVQYLMEEAIEFLGHKEIHQLVRETKEILHPVSYERVELILRLEKQQNWNLMHSGRIQKK